jgi:pantetheine hydrolase
MAQSGSSGSGIFSGEHGALTAILSTDPQRKLYVANVPKEPSSVEKPTRNVIASVSNNFENFYLGRDFLEEFRTTLLDPNRQAENLMLCHNQFCCRFNVEYDHLTNDDDEEGYHYRYAVFDGQRTFQGYASQNVSICGVMTCLNSTIESCGRLMTNSSFSTNSMRFRKLQISGTFNGLDALSMPNSLTTSFLPVPTDETTFLDAVISTSPK